MKAVLTTVLNVSLLYTKYSRGGNSICVLGITPRSGLTQLMRISVCVGGNRE